ncbi:MAG: alpha-hydroxy-acid oxidizing protein [Anaerolineae bacterium]|jgi:4-hydroxymandelate oxidase|nr:alpha-hydroxy-acid oxidizing protein [Anaerolineae bacterium]
MADTLQTPLNLFDYERMAAARLDPMVYGYYVGGANDEITLRENRESFNRISLRPRMMVDVGERDLSTVILGQRYATPIITAPMAFIALAHPDGERGVARAAGSLGIPMTLSTMATTSIEDVAAERAGPLWFQLYVYKDRGITRWLVERAETAGYEALVVTVDSPLLGKRERDVRNQFHLPEGYTAANLNDPSYRRVSAVDQGSGLASYIASLYDPALTWKDLEWFASITKMPIWVKGILRGDDAQRAVDHGASGIVVSNHGGRQLDTAIAGITALPEVIAAVNGRVDVLLDGGIRRGTDILKALAFGACGVMIGRPILWGLAVNGEQGVRDILTILRAELELAMALCGAPTVNEITPDLIV